MLNCFKNDQEGESFENALLNSGQIASVSRTIRLMQYVFLGLKGWIGNEDEYNEDKENYGMCKALSDIKKKAKIEGIKIGEEKGIKIGEEKGIKIGEENIIRKMILSLLERSTRLVDICAITGATEAKVREIAIQGNFLL